MIPAPLLAWLQLKHQPIRLAVALAGVAFAVVLMLMQLGFGQALYKSSVRLHEKLIGDIVLLSPQTTNLTSFTSFSRRRIYQALAVPGVASGTAIYAAMPKWKNPDNALSRDIFLIGVDPRVEVLDIAGLNAARELIQIPDQVLFDRRSRPEFGPVAEELAKGHTYELEIWNRRISVVGGFDLGTSFGVNGNLITSDLNFLRIVPGHPAELVELGLLRLAPGADPEAVRDAIERELPEDVVVLTRQRYIEREVAYWANVTPIGFVFGFGTIMALAVGGVIVYQILFADVSEHLSEYATLKAVGHTDAYLSVVVVSQALLLALLSFLPGYLIALRLYRLTEQATMLPMQLGIGLCSRVLGLTVVMCCLAGLLALRKVRSADPADVF